MWRWRVRKRELFWQETIIVLSLKSCLEILFFIRAIRISGLRKDIFFFFVFPGYHLCRRDLSGDRSRQSEYYFGNYVTHYFKTISYSEYSHCYQNAFTTIDRNSNQVISVVIVRREIYIYFFKNIFFSTSLVTLVIFVPAQEVSTHASPPYSVSETQRF